MNGGSSSCRTVVRQPEVEDECNKGENAEEGVNAHGSNGPHGHLSVCISVIKLLQQVARCVDTAKGMERRCRILLYGDSCWRLCRISRCIVLDFVYFILNFRTFRYFP